MLMTVIADKEVQMRKIRSLVIRRNSIVSKERKEVWKIQLIKTITSRLSKKKWVLTRKLFSNKKVNYNHKNL